MAFVKQAYIGGVRAARCVARATGVLEALELRRERPIMLWARTLFAIHDAEELVQLDIPWWTLRSIELMERFFATRRDASVYEYGAGASTAWLGRRSRRVRYVEHDARWKPMVDRLTEGLTTVSGELIEPVSIPDRDDGGGTRLFVSHKRGWSGLDFEHYVRAIESAGGPFDVIVIDGRCRDRCLEIAEPHLASDGVIVFDNSGRAHYRDAIERSGLEAIRTGGLTVSLPYADETTLLFASRETRDRMLSGG